MDSQTPSSYLYEELRSQARLSNRKAAHILLSNRPIFAGRSPRDRIDDRTFLSREVVHAHPDNANPSLFADFSNAAQTICLRMVDLQGGGDTAYDHVATHYAGEAAEHMAELLNLYGRDGQIYVNVTKLVLAAPLRREHDRAVLLVMAFIAAGCLGDPRAAATVVEQFMKSKLASDLVTQESASSRTNGVLERPAAMSLGLIRVIDGAVKPPIYPLADDGRITVIGSMPREGDAITNVDTDVSRQHLKIWQQDGSWWCQGMGSTNGSFVILGTTGKAKAIELPRALRGREVTVPVSFESGDTLCLGATTRFLVMRVRS